jgi:hypothetical protein
MAERFSLWIDKSAIGLSGLCLIHCLIGTLFLAALSAGGSGLLGHTVHQVGLAIAMPLAIVGLAIGIRQHGRWLVAAIGGLGIGFMAGALWSAHGGGEAAYTMIGVVLVAFAHLLNMRWLHA